MNDVDYSVLRENGYYDFLKRKNFFFNLFTNYHTIFLFCGSSNTASSCLCKIWMSNEYSLKTKFSKFMYIRA